MRKVDDKLSVILQLIKLACDDRRGTRSNGVCVRMVWFLEFLDGLVYYIGNASSIRPPAQGLYASDGVRWDLRDECVLSGSIRCPSAGRAGRACGRRKEAQACTFCFHYRNFYQNAPSGYANLSASDLGASDPASVEQSVLDLEVDTFGKQGFIS